MDISAPIIFVGILIVIAALLILVFKFGIKEKSYEEAIAEQRQQNNPLLGVKSKPKEKKSKKTSKKLKEKQPSTDNEPSEETAEHATQKPHVEFKEEPEELPAKPESPIKKPLKKVKEVRPILVNKECHEPAVKPTKEVGTANHFESSHPKDEFELLRSNSRDELIKQEPAKEKPAKEKKQSDGENVKSKKSKQAQPAVENVAPVAEKKEEKKIVEKKDEKKIVEKKEEKKIVEKKDEKKIVEKKEEKKIVEKKDEKKSVDKKDDKKTAPPDVEKKEEKKLEAAPAPSQVNGLPVNTAKEKKKKKSEFNTLQQLTTERDGLFTLVRNAELSRNEIQTLIELLLNKQHEAPAVIEDWTEGKSDPTQKLKKQLAEKEKLLAEETERNGALQNKLREIRTEQQAEKSQLVQKVRALEETLNAKNLEVEAEKNKLQASIQKWQQLQTQINEDSVKWQRLVEENKALQHQLESRVEAVVQLNAELNNANIEVHRLATENIGFTEIMRQRSSEMQNIERENEQLKMINNQLEETRKGFERDIEAILRREEEAQKELSHLKTVLQQQAEEKRKNEHSFDQILNENRQLKSDKTETSKLIDQLKQDLQKTQDEKQQLEVTQVNGSSEETENFKLELLNANNQLSSVQVQLQQTIALLDESNNKNNALLKEIEEQKSKNNDLSKDIRQKEQDSQKQFIQRLFPEIVALKSAASNEDWQQEFGRLIENYLENLKKKPSPKKESVSDDSSLRLQVVKYKNIIDETESQLVHLQNHVAQAETSWRDQLAEKNAEIEHLKEQVLGQLKIQLEEKDQLLAQEQRRSESLSKECQQMRSKAHQADANLTIEKLTEEVNRLSELLRLEQAKKNADVNGSSKEQNFKATNGLSLIEHSLSSSSTSLASSGVIHSKKSKNKKKKKKGNGN
ncbi:calponin homology domain-containing protein DDB_G0272472 isoform X3 [Aethina tumida]|uniref:calponin homology domain-containing protein DDB_G0272472 isoform X3 n=1 Tax=Aethina tumida TaxID=116153 RepID=UPI002148FA07|nr:calponin homology domain-containing protein DDB_G0272472 isoform X3 [Aethina tumida]